MKMANTVATATAVLLATGAALAALLLPSTPTVRVGHDAAVSAAAAVDAATVSADQGWG